MISDVDLVFKANEFANKTIPKDSYTDKIYNVIAAYQRTGILSRPQHTFLTEFCISCEMRNMEYERSKKK